MKIVTITAVREMYYSVDMELPEKDIINFQEMIKNDPKAASELLHQKVKPIEFADYGDFKEIILEVQK